MVGLSRCAGRSGPPPYPSASAESLCFAAFQQLLPDYLGASEVSPGADQTARLIIAGRELAEQIRALGQPLAAALAAPARVRDELFALCFRSFPDPDKLHQAISGIQRLADGLTLGMVNEWLRLQTMLHRQRHKEASHYLSREKKRYNMVFRRMSEPAFVVDRELRLVEVNPAFEKFFGLTGRECLGATCQAVIGHDFCHTCPLPQVVRQGGSFAELEVTIEVAIPGSGTGSRESRIVQLTGTALGGEGDDGGAIVVIQDITDFKHIELELDAYRTWLEELVDERTEELRLINTRLTSEIAERKQAQKELLRMAAALQLSNADLEQFAYVASHDLREPLMLITAFAERLRLHYGAGLDARGNGYVERIIKSAGTLSGLVEALLQLSRVSTCTRAFEMLDLNRLLLEVLEDLEEPLVSSGARVELGLLPTLHGDPVQIRQLFQNLISNALKYRRVEETPVVTVSGQILEEGNCEITVADNGIGMAEEDLERIFEPFVRLHGREAYEGCGMGLATCRKIVERHGGAIKAHSQPGQGTVLVLRLPTRHHEARDGHR